MNSSSVDDYLKDLNQLFSDLKLTVESIDRHTAILSLMGDRVFSYAEILQHYNLEAPLPLIPPALTTDLLSSPCPYDNGKRICDTHFLFPIPVCIPGKEYSVKVFFDSFGADSSTGPWFYFTSNPPYMSYIELNSSQERSKLSLDTDYQQSEWVLLYSTDPAQEAGAIKKGYRIGWTQEFITARTFWLKRGKEFPYLVDTDCIYHFKSPNPENENSYALIIRGFIGFPNIVLGGDPISPGGFVVVRNL